MGSVEEHVLFGYSEWLDAQGVLMPPDDGDQRTHTDLVLEYLHEQKGI